MLALLRVLQTEAAETFDGNWSWVPYAITLVPGALVGALAVSRVRKQTLQRRPRRYDQNQISRDDLEAKLSSLQTGFGRKIADRRKTIITVGGGVGLAMSHVFFLLGRRSGTKKTTIVEIRQV